MTHPSIFRQKLTLNNGRIPPPVLLAPSDSHGSPRSPRTLQRVLLRVSKSSLGLSSESTASSLRSEQAGDSQTSHLVLLFSSGLACSFKCPQFKDLGPRRSSRPASLSVWGSSGVSMRWSAPPCPPGAAASPPNHPIGLWATRRYFLPNLQALRKPVTDHWLP